jgi:uncharacterized repeat protein (TIGR02543 family)
MRRVVVLGLLALALAMVLGVGSAGGHTLFVSTVTVQVIGPGKVKSDPSVINCGNEKTTCYAAFSSGQTFNLIAVPQGDWILDHWDGACLAAGTGSTCTLNNNGSNYDAVAVFSGPPTGTSTLAVTAELVDTDADGTPDSGGQIKGDGINCGSGVNSCSTTVLTGSTLTMRETTDPNFTFDGWGGECHGVDAACAVTMDANKSVSGAWSTANVTQLLTVTISGNGKVTGAGLNCNGPATCTKDEPNGATVILTADPENGFVLSAWSGACAGSATTCTVTMDAARSVTATFTLAVKLTVSVSGNGNVSGGSGAISCGSGGDVCSANFAQNATVTLVATPATGATFTGWTGACGGTATSCTVLMNESRNVTATFSGGTAGGAGFLLSVSVSGAGTVTGAGINCGNGATTCSTTPAVNSSVTLTATPAAGATFSGWGGSCSGTIPTCTVQMTAARSVTATFTTGGGGATVRLTVSVTGSGTVSGGGITCGNGSGACTANLTTGSSVTLTATPATGATFTAWGGACTGSAPTCTVSMTSAKSVTATFTTLAPGTLAITVKGKGTVSAPLGKCIGTSVTKTCIQKYAKGRTVTLTAAAAAGNVFAGWDGACVAAAKKPTCTVTLTTAKSVTATFVPSTGGGGGVTRPVLTSLGPPIVRHTAAGFRVTLRFNTTRGGIARVVGLRAGRVGARITFRIAAGPARIGPFTVVKPGLYTFQVRLGTALLQWRVCLGRCGAAAPPPPFVLIRQPPTVTRSGDVWSVTLHVRSNQIAVARVRAVKGGKVLVDRRFLANTGEISIGPFLLGPGSYTLRLNATDAYGRTRSLTWVVALAT